jgi:tight adherence protein B
MVSPASDEFRKVRREVELGLPMSQALINLTNRMESDDLFLIVTAININTQVGGNLTVMLDAVSETIRERIRILGEVRVLTSYARYSSYLLSALPFITSGVIFLMNPSYMEKLLEPGITRYMLIGALSGILLGNIWLRRLAKIEV